MIKLLGVFIQATMLAMVFYFGPSMVAGLAQIIRDIRKEAGK